MNLTRELLKEHSKAQATKICHYIGTDKKRFADLMDIFFHSDYRLNQRSAYVLNMCYDKQPRLVEPYISQLIQNLHNGGLHDTVKRNTVRILQFITLPEELMGEAADICFHYLRSSKEPIAIKAFSMTVLANICHTYPELKNELQPLIEDMLPHGSAGIKNRGEKILSQLREL